MGQNDSLIEKQKKKLEDMREFVLKTAGQNQTGSGNARISREDVERCSQNRALTKAPPEAAPDAGIGTRSLTFTPMDWVKRVFINRYWDFVWASTLLIFFRSAVFRMPGGKTKPSATIPEGWQLQGTLDVAVFLAQLVLASLEATRKKMRYSLALLVFYLLSGHSDDARNFCNALFLWFYRASRDPDGCRKWAWARLSGLAPAFEYPQWLHETPQRWSNGFKMVLLFLANFAMLNMVLPALCLDQGTGQGEGCGDGSAGRSSSSSSRRGRGGRGRSRSEAWQVACAHRWWDVVARMAALATLAATLHWGHPMLSTELNRMACCGKTAMTSPDDCKPCVAGVTDTFEVFSPDLSAWTANMKSDQDWGGRLNDFCSQLHTHAKVYHERVRTAGVAFQIAHVVLYLCSRIVQSFGTLPESFWCACSVGLLRFVCIDLPEIVHVKTTLPVKFMLAATADRCIAVFVVGANAFIWRQHAVASAMCILGALATSVLPDRALAHLSGLYCDWKNSLAGVSIMGSGLLVWFSPTITNVGNRLEWEVAPAMVERMLARALDRQDNRNDPNDDRRIRRGGNDGRRRDDEDLINRRAEQNARCRAENMRTVYPILVEACRKLLLWFLHRFVGRNSGKEYCTYALTYTIYGIPLIPAIALHGRPEACWDAFLCIIHTHIAVEEYKSSAYLQAYNDLLLKGGRSQSQRPPEPAWTVLGWILQYTFGLG